jgi:hypothetical protein
MGRTGGGTDGPRVERVSVHQGALQVDPPAVHAIAPPSRRAAESRGALYVLVAPVASASLAPALTTELVKLIGETYYELTGSITRGLRGALLAANEMLFDLNVRADAAQRTIAGVVCAVIRQEDLYVAQMGPAVTITSRGMDSRRYPDHSAWITNEQPVGVELDREPPLGLRRDAEPSLFHASYRPDDLVVLSSAGLVREASDGEVAAASLRTAHDDLTSALMDLANGRDFVLMVVRPVRPTMTSEQPTPIVTTPPVSARQMAGRAPAAPEIDETLGSGSTTSHDLPYSPFGAPAAPRTPSDTAATREPVSGTPAEVPADDTEISDEAYADTVYGSARVEGGQPVQFGAFGDIEPAMDLAEDDGVEIIHTPRPVIDMAQIADTLTDRARRLRDGTENVLLGVLPKEIPPRPVEPDRPGISVGGKALVAVALIIPLIVLFTVVMTRVQYDRARAAQYSNAINQAQYLYDLAVRQEDRQLKRDDLYRALSVIDQGLALTPANVDLQDLRRRAQHQIDQVEGVVPIYAFARLYYFEDGPVSVTDSSRIAVRGKDVMVLNRGSDRVYRFFLNDVGDALQPVQANPVILRRGDVLDGETVSDLVDLNFMASEGSQTLARFIVLDRAGRLLSYDAARGMRSQPVGNADLWLSPQAIGSFYGNLYVLDPLLGRLFKYLPSNNEYVKTPLDYFDAALGVDLTGAVDMAIDSNVYILFADGTIKKYNNGQPVEFGMRGFYGTMRSPVAIYVSGGQAADAVGYVYVADAGNNRVLQFTKDGNFVRQFRAVESEPYMNNLRGLYVDEAERRMFLVSGEHFVLCTLPALQQ